MRFSPDSLEQVRQEVERLLQEGKTEEAVSLLASQHVSDQAKLFTDFSPSHQQDILTSLSPRESAKLLEHLNPEEAAHVAGTLESPALSDVLDATRPDVAADILRHIPSDQARETLEEMQRGPEVEPLTLYADDTAGGLMAPVAALLPQHLTVAQTIAHLRQSRPPADLLNRVFVVDDQRRLVGYAPLRSLLLADPDLSLREIMNPEVISVTHDTDREACARLMEHYDLLDVPVVDGGSRLLGAITFQNLVDVVEQEATEDMYQMARMDPRERIGAPLLTSVWRRLPWLLVNLGTVVLAAVVISLFESTIARMVALAAFLPVVAGQGGAAGTQTLTLAVRSMALGEVDSRTAVRLVGKEVSLGLINGVVLGVVIGALGFVWKDSAALGIALFVAMTVNLIVAGLTGALVPLGLRAVRVDPALASAVVVTTFTDVAGFALFLGLAAFLLRHMS